MQQLVKKITKFFRRGWSPWPQPPGRQRADVRSAHPSAGDRRSPPGWPSTYHTSSPPGTAGTAPCRGGSVPRPAPGSTAAATARQQPAQPRHAQGHRRQQQAVPPRQPPSGPSRQITRAAGRYGQNSSFPISQGLPLARSQQGRQRTRKGPVQQPQRRRRCRRREKSQDIAPQFPPPPALPYAPGRGKRTLSDPTQARLRVRQTAAGPAGRRSIG